MRPNYLPPHVAVVLHQVRHVDIRRLANPLARPLLLLRRLTLTLSNLQRVLARRLLSHADQFSMHVVETGDRDAVPHDSKLVLDRVVERGVVGPDISWKVVLLCPHDKNLVLVLERGDGVFAVGPSVFKVFD